MYGYVWKDEDRERRFATVDGSSCGRTERE